jgi:outer membrane protein TolC
MLKKLRVLSKQTGPALLLAMLLFAFLGAGAQDVIQRGEILKLDKCVQITLDHLPALLAARATSEADRSLVRQVESAYYPQVAWSTSLSRASVGSVVSSGFRTSAGTYSSFSTGLSLSQNIFDFGKTPTQVKIQKLTYNSSVADIETASQQAVFTVKQSYYGVLQAKHNKEVADDAVKQYQLHLDQAKGQYDVGLAPKYDVTEAQVNLGNAKLNLIKAQYAVKLALAMLNNSMGINGMLDYDVEDDMAFEAYNMSFEEALAEAYSKRPDLTSIVDKRQAAESSITLAKTGFLPTLAGSASFDYAGYAFPVARGWSLGLSFNIPVFNGFLTVAQVAQARANLNVLRANEETQRQSIYLAVQQAYLNLKQAEELVPVAELNVTAAQENLDIANGSYKEGVGDPIQVADAENALITAKIAYIEALYECKVGRASLELAMGLR